MLIIIAYVILFPSMLKYIHREVYNYQRIHAFEELTKRSLYQQYGDNYEITGYKVHYYNTANTSWTPFGSWFDNYIESIDFEVKLSLVPTEKIVCMGPDTSITRKAVNR